MPEYVYITNKCFILIDEKAKEALRPWGSTSIKQVFFVIITTDYLADALLVDVHQ